MCQSTKTPKRLCCVCDSTLHGRSDKIFCNYRCKNKYHSALRKHTKSVSAQTISKLNRNYHILSCLFGQNTEKIVINKLELIRQGYHFDVISGVESNKYGFKFQVYDYSWYLSKNQNLIVYRNKDQAELIPFVYKRWERTMKDKQTGT